MLTIHHEAHTTYHPAYDETYYTLDELTPKARRAAIGEWVDANGVAYVSDACDEIEDALESILDQLPNHYRSWDKGGNLWLSVFATGEFAGFYGHVDDGRDCYYMDMADAWNAHADEIADLAERLNDTDWESDEYDAIEEELTGALNAAFEDVAHAYNRLCEWEHDYLMGGDAFVETYSWDYLFDEDGNAYQRDEVARDATPALVAA